jgi:eukaryotic-like serine/threonine-protein kinase
MTDREIFVEALSRPASVREAFLTSACGSDQGQFERVYELLELHGEEASVLNRAPADALRQNEETQEFTKPTAQTPLDGYLQPSTRADSLGRLGHYEILKRLGEGGFGIVLKAFDDVLHRVVAIKVMHPELAKTSPPRKRFLREARAAAAVKHENVVQIYAVHEEPLPHLVMEFVDGQTLQDLMNANGPFDPKEIIRLGRQIALGLAAAHDKGLVHRDIKPANLMLENGIETKIKLTDFGLAQTNDAASITQSGLIAGTPLYMSPEQACGEPLDARSDLFSLGSVLYAMCAGHPPFRASSAMAVLKRVAGDDHRPIPDIIPETPAGVVAVVEKLLQKQPENRFASAHEVASALDCCLTETIPSPKVQKKNWKAAIAAAVAVSVFAGLGLSIANRPQTTTDTARETSPIVAAPPTLETPPKLTWQEATAALPPLQQIESVKVKLREANPMYDLDMAHFFLEDGAVEACTFKSGKNLYDFQPLKGFPKLRRLIVLNYDGKVALTTMAGLPLTHVDVCGYPFRDLTPLRGMQLKYLSVWRFGGDSLAPLVGMPIRELNCGNSDVKDLTPLSAMPLEILTLNLTPVEDLRPLTNLPLQVLRIQNTKVRNIEPLAKMKLSILLMKGSPIADYSILSQIPTLEEITLDYVASKHEKLLQGLPNLRKINDKPAAEIFRNSGQLTVMPQDQQIESVKTKLREANPLYNLDMSDFIVKDGAVAGCTFKSAKNLDDLLPLTSFPKLRRLTVHNYDGKVSLKTMAGLPLTHVDVCGYPFRDLTPLRGMKLQFLSVWGFGGDSLAPLAGMPIRELNCGASDVKDLTPLSAMPLETLTLNLTKVEDLRPLTNLPLKVLLIENTNVRNIEPLAKLKLSKLMMKGSPITDYSILSQIPTLEEISLNYVAEKHEKLLRGLPKLKMINEKPAAETVGNPPQRSGKPQ